MSSPNDNLNWVLRTHLTSRDAFRDPSVVYTWKVLSALRILGLGVAPWFVGSGDEVPGCPRPSSSYPYVFTSLSIHLFQYDLLRHRLFTFCTCLPLVHTFSVPVDGFDFPFFRIRNSTPSPLRSHRSLPTVPPPVSPSPRGYRCRIRRLGHLYVEMFRFPGPSILLHFLDLHPLIGPHRSRGHVRVPRNIPSTSSRCHSLL